MKDSVLSKCTNWNCFFFFAVWVVNLVGVSFFVLVFTGLLLCLDASLSGLFRCFLSIEPFSLSTDIGLGLRLFCDRNGTGARIGLGLG